ncbi:MAG: TMEM175 family protein [Bacteroidota bacterium]
MSHPHHDLFENRRQFQLERLILFSDAVFAIAITLLVIEIKVPEIHFGTGVDVSHALAEALNEKSAEFFGFLLSFAVIGQFWVGHHRLFGYVTDYDSGLLWLNLHMLFWIVLVPFSSALNARYGPLDSVWEWYSFNMFMIALSLFFIWRYIGNPKRKLSLLANDPRLRKMAAVRNFSIAIIFLLGLLLCLPGLNITSQIARFIYVLIFPAMWIVNRRYRLKK